MKKNAALGFSRLGLACALVWLWAHPAYAEPSVLLLEPPAAPSGFLTALQIQLSGLASAERVGIVAAPHAAEAIERASELVRTSHALAAVWLERGTSNGPAIVYVVGDREGRALVEVVRVQGDRGPDLDRAAALKVRELVAAIQRGQAARPEAAQLLQAEPPTPPLAAAPNEQPEDTADPAPSWSALAFAGLRLGSQPAFGLGRWGFGLGAGPVVDLRAFRLAVGFGFDAFPSISVDRAGERVRFWEWSASASLQAQLRAGAVWLGGRAGPELVGLNATGFTRQGNTGSATPTAWALALGVDAELPLTSSVSLIASLQLQALANRLHLDVNDVPLVDLGRFRAHIGADAVARF